MPIKLLMAGMRGTGKSTLTISLYEALRATRPDLSVGCHELDPYSDTHALIRGEKTDVERKSLKQCDFERVLVERHIMPFRRDPRDIVIGDLPGKLTNPRMGEMMSHGTHAIVVGRHDVEKDHTGRFAKHHRGVEHWVQHLERRDIAVVARVQSLLPGQSRWDGFFHIEGLVRTPLPTISPILQLAELVGSLHDNAHQMRLVA